MRQPVARWLALCALLVFLMVVVGGLTRLTESGLSIVEWKPISGIFPPLSHTAWEEEFSAYQHSPQYQKINFGMTLTAFKGIFWLEYIHRLLGRLIGIIFLIPCAFFIHKRALPAYLIPRLIFIFILGGIQGAIGWYMVKSGLVHEPAVSPLRLAFHLGMALVIFALLLWSWRDALEPHEKKAASALPQFLTLGAWSIVFLIFLQMILGALVAGLDAGLVYNTFPLMDGKFIPEGLYKEVPWYYNLYESIVTVQFNHRLVAYFLAILIPTYCCAALTQPIEKNNKILLFALFFLFILQFILGVATLVYIVPIPLASLHQANAALLFATAVLWCRALRKKYKKT